MEYTYSNIIGQIVTVKISEVTTLTGKVIYSSEKLGFFMIEKSRFVFTLIDIVK